MRSGAENGLGSLFSCNREPDRKERARRGKQAIDRVQMGKSKRGKAGKGRARLGKQATARQTDPFRRPDDPPSILSAVCFRSCICWAEHDCQSACLSHCRTDVQTCSCAAVQPCSQPPTPALRPLQAKAFFSCDTVHPAACLDLNPAINHPPAVCTFL